MLGVQSIYQTLLAEEITVAVLGHGDAAGVEQEQIAGCQPGDFLPPD